MGSIRLSTTRIDFHALTSITVPPVSNPSVMYLTHFALVEAPFSIAPDPRYLYMSQRHQEALAHLLYGLSGEGGFVLLTGEIGAGKTTVCRCLLEQIPAACDVAYIFNPKLTVLELLETLCSEFRIAVPPEVRSVKQWVDAINAYLLDGHARGRHAVLIIDEAQNLSAEVLEQMRLLTNLETHQRKLLQIILIGQPELATILAQPALRQLAQRVVARYHLGALSRGEVAAYVWHRLSVAGVSQRIIPRRVMGQLHRLSDGTPRIINLLCDRALLGAYVEGKQAVDGGTLRRAALEVFPARQPLPLAKWPVILFGLLLASSLALGGGWWMKQRQHVALAAKVPPAIQPIKLAPVTPPSAPVAVAPKEGGQKEEAPKAEPLKPQAPMPVEAMKPEAPKPEAAKPATAIAAADTAPLEWPKEASRAQSRDMAFAALFQAWYVAYNPGDYCKASRALRCRTASSGIEELRQINRPALLYLTDSDGQEFHATLTGLQQQVATLQIAGTMRTVSLDRLAMHWSGRSTILWRAPSQDIEHLRSGARGPEVSWLAAQLDKALGPAPGPLGEPQLDGALRQRIKQFQLAYAQVPDGQLSLPTLVRLSGVGDTAAPTLSPPAR